MATPDLSLVRLSDETLREGDSRGYHTHSPAERIELLRLIHDVTGIKRFSTLFAVVNENDRETLLAIFEARRRGAFPKDAVPHIASWFQAEASALSILAALDPADRQALSFSSAATSGEGIARGGDGPWVLAHDGSNDDWKTLPWPELSRRLAQAFEAMTRRYVEAGAHDVDIILQDAFRCSLSDLELFATAGFAGGGTSLTLHDTVGTATPDAVIARLAYLRDRFPGVPLGVHFHNDFGMASANTITALAHGAVVADVTATGVGNRAGNAPAEAVLMALKVMYGTELPGVNYGRLTELARTVERYFALLQSPFAPITGRLLHLDEAGPRTHLMETVGPATFLPYDPRVVGGHMEAAHAPSSGRTSVDLLLQRNADKLRRAQIELGKDLVDRAFAWVNRERVARAERHRPTVLATMENYERALRASYVTDEDIVARALASGGRFD
jgi:isopropylmalate/homocitrate/citramalate synthase